MIKVLLAALGLSVFLTACAPDVLDRPADVGTANQLFSALQDGRYDLIEAMADPELRKKGLRSPLIQMRSLLPSSQATSMTVAQYGAVKIMNPAGTVRRVNLELQAGFGEQWFLASFQWRTENQGSTILEGFHLQPLAMPLETLNAFTFQGKGGVHYAILAMAVLAPIISVTALALCLFSSMPRRRKVLWAVGILFGVCQVSLNWTSGEVMVNPLFFQLLSGGYTRAGLGPFIVRASVPLFALLFLVRWYRDRRRAA